MTTDPEVLRVLRERTGLRIAALEGESGTSLIRRRMQATGLDRIEAYRERVARDPAELEALAAAVAVPETWFFRYPSSCEWLIGWLRARRRDPETSGGVRLLSAPCATGQEPISLAICAAVAGWPLEAIEVEAVDSSSVAIEIARSARERPLPVRDALPEWALPWFETTGAGVRPRAELFNRIRFESADLRDWNSVGNRRFDVVACRNLLIYLEPSARRRVMRTCDRSLLETGVLLLGHADHDAELLRSFEPVGVPQSFAHRRLGRRDAVTPGAPGVGSSPSTRPRRSAAAERASAVSTTTPTSKPRHVGVSSRRPAGSDASLPTSPEAWIEADRARSLADAGRLAEAERLCVDRLEQAPAELVAIELLGCIRLAESDLESAGEWFRKLVYLAPDHVEGLLQLASIAETMGDMDQATRHRERARRIGASSGGPDTPPGREADR